MHAVVLFDDRLPSRHVSFLIFHAVALISPTLSSCHERVETPRGAYFTANR
jgi:hypothetical protein